MSDCLFCKIVAGEIPGEFVHQDDKVVVFKDIYPKAKVHLLVVPREHVVSLREMDQQHNELLAHMLLLQPKLAAAHGLDSGFRTIINSGKGGGQVIFHLHMHLMGGPDLPGFE